MRLLAFQLFSVIFAVSLHAASDEFDLVIENGRIVDGSGSPWYLGDLALRDGVIVAIGDLDDNDAEKTIDASGLVVAPGFIDPHIHSVNPNIPTLSAIFRIPTADNLVRQGITTIVDGNDGRSPLPIGDYLKQVEDKRLSLNFALYVGQGSVRRKVMGMADRPPTDDELGQMKSLIARSMKEGAIGISTGLAYTPSGYADTDEVIALSEVAAEYGGIYISHMRDETSGLLESVRETIRIGEGAKIPVQMTHHKAIGHKQFGLSVETIRLMEEARSRGVDITFDQYPYTAGSTGLPILFPQWALADGKLLERLDDPELFPKIKAGLMEKVELRFGEDAWRIQFNRCASDPSLTGKTMEDLLNREEIPVSLDAMADMIIELQRQGGCICIYHQNDEADVERLLTHPYGMVGSDGSLVGFGIGGPHPRSYGTYPRILGHYVRERKVLSLEEAVRKMTSFPAQRLGFHRRGLLREGMTADITIFDPDTVIDRATFTDPHQYPVGIEYVIVNGEIVIEKSEHTGARPGQVLYGPGK
jgi:N-acyl-D-aspartate/D-glutamate deacylase